MIELEASGSQATLGYRRDFVRAAKRRMDARPPWIHHAAPGGSIGMRGSRCFEDQEVGVAALHNSPGVCSWPASVLASSWRARLVSSWSTIIEANVYPDVARMKTLP